MQITTLITAGKGTFLYDEEGAAAQVLAALGGNPADDTSTARIDNVNLTFAVNVNLGAGDNMPYTPDQAAQQVLAALGGNPTTDNATVYITMPTTGGSAGTDT